MKTVILKNYIEDSYYQKIVKAFETILKTNNFISPNFEKAYSTHFLNMKIKKSD